MQINFGSEGGLYAEQIVNRDFETLGRGRIAGVAEEPEHSTTHAPQAFASPPSPAIPAGALNAQTVMIETEDPQGCKTRLSSLFWLPITDMQALGISPNMSSCSYEEGRPCGSIVVGGENLTLSQINPANGNDPCGKCNCPLAFFSLAEGFTLPAGIDTMPGSKVSMRWSPHEGPPAGLDPGEPPAIPSSFAPWVGTTAGTVLATDNTTQPFITNPTTLKLTAKASGDGIRNPGKYHQYSIPYHSYPFI